MLAAAPDGRILTVRRRWIPWRPSKKREITDAGFVNLLDGADDPVSAIALLVASLVATVVVALLLTFGLFAGEILLLAVVLVPLLGIARVLWIVPWIIESTRGDTVLGIEKVRGWRASSERIAEIAAAYERGEDPFRGSHRAV